MNQRLLKLLVAELCYTVDYLAPENVPAAIKSMNEEYKEYGEGVTRAQWLRENHYLNMPKAGWQWLVELNGEECAAGYGYDTYEDAAMAAFKKYGPKETPAAVVTKALLTSWHFGAQHIGHKRLRENDKYGRYDVAYYLQRLRDWYRMANHEPAKLEKVWGFAPDVEAARAVFWQYRAEISDHMLNLAEERIEQLIPIEQLRAEAEQVGVKVVLNQKAQYEWVWPAMSNQLRDGYESERAALVDVCRMNGGLCGLKPSWQRY